MLKTEELVKRLEKLQNEELLLKKDAFKEIISDPLFEFLDVDVKGCLVGYNGKMYYIEEFGYEIETERGQYGQYSRSFNDTEIMFVVNSENHLTIQMADKMTRNYDIHGHTYKTSKKRPQLRDVPTEDLVLISDIIFYCIKEIKGDNCPKSELSEQYELEKKELDEYIKRH